MANSCSLTIIHVTLVWKHCFCRKKERKVLQEQTGLACKPPCVCVRVCFFFSPPEMLNAESSLSRKKRQMKKWVSSLQQDRSTSHHQNLNAEICDLPFKMSETSSGVQQPFLYPVSGSQPAPAHLNVGAPVMRLNAHSQVAELAAHFFYERLFFLRVKCL